MKDKFYICYDISSNKRRRKVVNILEEKGVRYQYSVFHCILSKKEFIDISVKIKRILKKKKDSLIIIPVNDYINKKSLFYGTVKYVIQKNKEPSFF